MLAGVDGSLDTLGHEDIEALRDLLNRPSPGNARSTSSARDTRAGRGQPHPRVGVEPARRLVASGERLDGRSVNAAASAEMLRPPIAPSPVGACAERVRPGTGRGLAVSPWVEAPARAMPPPRGQPSAVAATPMPPPAAMRSRQERQSRPRPPLPRCHAAILMMLPSSCGEVESPAPATRSPAPMSPDPSRRRHRATTDGRGDPPRTGQGPLA